MEVYLDCSMQEQVFGLKCAFFYILTQILPRSVEGKLSAPLPSRTSFGYGSFAVVLALWHFLAFFFANRNMQNRCPTVS